MFLLDGPMPKGMEEAIAEVDSGNSSFVAPELILVESGHVLTRKRSRGLLSDKEAETVWRNMRKTPMDLLAAEDHIDRAMAVAQRHRLSVYDAMYLAVAEYVGGTLLTADDALARVGKSVLLG